MKIKLKALFILLLFSWLTNLNAQEKIAVDYVNMPLNQVFIGLRDSFHIKFSFNDAKLSQHTITLKKEFVSLDDLLEGILYGTPWMLEKRDNIYIVVDKPENLFDADERAILINGLVADKFSGEILPYSTVLINNELRVTDFRGRFSYIAYSGDLLHIKATHLGYYVFDTIIPPRSQVVCGLIPSNMELGEVMVEGKPVDYAAQAGNEVGEVRLNQKIAGFIPGGLNNSVYNILRLQPGIKGSVDHNQSLSIWGSAHGQNQTKFDGMTIYNLNSYSDYFNSVNPLLIKDINIYKGGYGSNQGNRVGGIIEINGIDGNYNKPGFELYADNLSLNAMVSIPMLKRSSLVVGHRRSLFPYFNMDMSRKFGDFYADDFSDVYVLPENTFQDLNVKFSSFLNNGDQFFVSGFNSRATDLFRFDYHQGEPDRLIYNHDQTMRQTGLAAFYGKLWGNGINSNFKMTYSGYNSHGQKELTLNPGDFVLNTAVKDDDKNRIDEFGLTIDNRFSLTTQQFVEAGLELNHYETTLSYTRGDYPYFNQANILDKVSLYARNNIQASDRLKMDIGLRLDYALKLNKMLFQPRLRSSVKLWNDLKLNLTWGVYNQFISVISLVDSDDNYHYFWKVPGDSDAPFLQSDVLGGGLSWSGNGFLLNAEGYVRRTEGLERFKIYQMYSEESTGLSKSQGLDFFVKKDFGKHTLWFSYSFNDTREHFSDMPEGEYLPARNSLKHEYKAASILNFKPLYFSLNYVYGSGFNKELLQNIDKEMPYYRLDASVYYRMEVLKSKLRFGINALNVTNRKNYPYLSQTNLSRGSEPNLIVSNAHQPFFLMFFVDISY
ncbi:TonB-dependent receptor plug domain-containing protein [Saccharicrinis sp. FJH62]|uniref:TonB-dependent receptor plug domain-containing protein n=1 Tax=Saccharicrinis sp. FJH62 TaxID=3344657 RepID=UPI0035D51632